MEEGRAHVGRDRLAVVVDADRTAPSMRIAPHGDREPGGSMPRSRSLSDCRRTAAGEPDRYRGRGDLLHRGSVLRARRPIGTSGGRRFASVSMSPGRCAKRFVRRSSRIATVPRFIFSRSSEVAMISCILPAARWARDPRRSRAGTGQRADVAVGEGVEQRAHRSQRGLQIVAHDELVEVAHLIDPTPLGQVDWPAPCSR